MIYYSPLRYPGGKSKLFNYIVALLEKNKLKDVNYVEPYAGGASLAFKLLAYEYAENIYINDIDKSIYSLYYSILNNTDELIKKINKTPVTINEWEKQRSIYRNKLNTNHLELGFSTLYLNRTNRSGIIGAGPIGGMQQNSEWKIDVRFNKENLIERIKFIASHSERIHIYNLDAISFLTKIVKKLPEEHLIYLDPPYFNKGKELYKNFYSYKDHLDIFKKMNSFKKRKWLVSYDNTPQIREIWKNFYHEIYSIKYTAGTKKEGAEIMFYSKNLKVPSNEIAYYK